MADVNSQAAPATTAKTAPVVTPARPARLASTAIRARAVRIATIATAVRSFPKLPRKQNLKKIDLRQVPIAMGAKIAITAMIVQTVLGKLY
jgi:hypothetical protein